MRLAPSGQGRAEMTAPGRLLMQEAGRAQGTGCQVAGHRGAGEGHLETGLAAGVWSVGCGGCSRRSNREAGSWGTDWGCPGEA